MPKVSESHVESRREQILDGARRAFARHGYEGATVVRLEEEIGLSRGAIFNYYPNKWELFYALAQEDQHRAGELRLEHGLAAVLRWVVEQSPEWIGVYLEIHRVLRTNPELRSRWEQRNPELDRRLRARVEQQQRRGELRADVGVDDIEGFLGLIVDGLVLNASAGATYDLEALLKLVVGAIGPQ
jgi:TetR/AcrR family transcriptional regulator, transcriptional repressor of aconitase